MNIDNIINDHLNDGDSPEQAAEAALARGTRKQLVELVRPVIVWRARSKVRERTRRVENRVSRSGPMAAQTVTRRALVRERFPLPDGRFVAWGEATAEDHLARAAWQRDHASRCTSDAELHEQAAKEITDAGVACLDEIEGGMAV